jgi:hypothetical protein
LKNGELCSGEIGGRGVGRVLVPGEEWALLSEKEFRILE